MQKFMMFLSAAAGVLMALYITYDGQGDLGERYFRIGNSGFFIGAFYLGESK